MTASRSNSKTVRLCFIGTMAAIIFIVNYLRIPFMGTQLHLTNGLCALAGLLLGPGAGFLAAGIGSFLFDIVAGYGVESLVTFVSKGAIALIAALIGHKAAFTDPLTSKEHTAIIIGGIVGAFTYVALYMLKTLIFGLTIKGLTMDATAVSMLSKLPGSMINAVFASIVSPIAFNALRPALRHAGLWENLL